MADDEQDRDAAGRAPVPTDELVEMIGYALWRHRDLRPRRPSLDETRHWAAKVVEHLMLCGVGWFRRRPARDHGTPAEPPDR